jgi:hypothetical protein
MRTARSRDVRDEALRSAVRDTQHAVDIIDAVIQSNTEMTSDPDFPDGFDLKDVVILHALRVLARKLNELYNLGREDLPPVEMETLDEYHQEVATEIIEDYELLELLGVESGLRSACAWAMYGLAEMAPQQDA